MILRKILLRLSESTQCSSKRVLEKSNNYMNYIFENPQVSRVPRIPQIPKLSEIAVATEKKCRKTTKIFSFPL